MATSFSSMPPPPSAFIGAWAAAIYSTEGTLPQNLATRQNNPGNLVANGVFRSFPTMAAGWQALYADLAAKIQLYPGYTFNEIMSCADGITHCYAPGSVGYGQICADGINAALGTTFDGNSTIGNAAMGVDDSPTSGGGEAAAQSGGLVTGNGEAYTSVPPQDYSGDLVIGGIDLSAGLTGSGWLPWAAIGVGLLAIAGEL